MLRLFGRTRSFIFSPKQIHQPSSYLSNSVIKDGAGSNIPKPPAPPKTPISNPVENSKKTSVFDDGSNGKLSFGGTSLRDSLRRVEIGLVKPVIDGKVVSSIRPPPSPPKPTASPAQATAAVKPNITSQAVANNTKTAPVNNNNTAKSSSSTATKVPSARSISADIMSVVAAKPVSFANAMKGAKEEDIETEPILDGERRFKQQQQKINIKRQKLAEEFGSDFGPNRTVSRRGIEPMIQMREAKVATNIDAGDSSISTKLLSVDSDPTTSRFSVAASTVAGVVRLRKDGDSLAAALESVKASKAQQQQASTKTNKDDRPAFRDMVGDIFGAKSSRSSATNQQQNQQQHSHNNKQHNHSNSNTNNSNNKHSHTPNNERFQSQPSSSNNRNNQHDNRRFSPSSSSHSSRPTPNQHQHQQQPHQNSPRQKEDRLFDPAYRLKKRRDSIERYLEENDMQTAAVSSPTTVVQTKKLVIPVDGLSLRQIAQRMSAKLVDVRVKLEEMGEWSAETMTEDSLLDADVVEILALDLGFSVQRVIASAEEAEGLYDDTIRSKVTFRQRQATQNAKLEASGALLSIRPPTVCIVGHVDHGKTTLLDALRSSPLEKVNPASSSSKSKGKKDDKSNNNNGVEKLTDGEAGGITQRLSAFSVDTGAERGSVVFLDTPGHAAFSSMRHKGAAATDIAVVVIAIDEGIMPQTEEAVRAVTSAGCAVVVALNKIDKLPLAQRPAARAKILANLAQFDLLAEELGGEVQVVEVAAKTGEGVASLLEAIAVQSDVLDLKCVTEAPAEAMVLDAKLEKGRGIVADVIVRTGSLKVGDAIVVGNVAGRVKALYDDKNRAITLAAPSQPVRLLGLKELPMSGAELLVVDSEARAKTIADRRAKIALLRHQQQQQQLNQRNVIAASATGDAAAPVAADAAAAAVKQKVSLGVVLKADSLGALEALQRIVDEIARACGDDVSVRVAASGVGSVTQSDVDILGSSSSSSSSSAASSSSSSSTSATSSVTETMILAFNVSVADNATKAKAKQLDMDIVRDDVIYRLEDALKTRIEELLPAERIETREGQARVLKVFKLKDKKNTVVAGSSITHGRVTTLNHLVKEENKALQQQSGSSASSNSGARVNGFYRVIRQGTVIHEHPMSRIELKRFKDAASEVLAGLECGLSFDGYSDINEGDEIECYKVSLKRRSLSLAPVFQYRPQGAQSS